MDLIGIVRKIERDAIDIIELCNGVIAVNTKLYIDPIKPPKLLWSIYLDTRKFFSDSDEAYSIKNGNWGFMYDASDSIKNAEEAFRFARKNIKSIEGKPIEWY